MPAETRVVSRHGGFAELMHFNADDTITVERTADVEPVLEANKRRQNDNPSGMSPSREWKHIACVPAIVQLRWIEMYGADPMAKGNGDLLRRVLNDPDWRWLRTGSGRF